MITRIVTTTSVFEPGYPGEKAIKRLAGLGFEGLDMALDYWVQPGSLFLDDTNPVRFPLRPSGESEDHTGGPR